MTTTIADFFEYKENIYFCRGDEERCLAEVNIEPFDDGLKRRISNCSHRALCSSYGEKISCSPVYTSILQLYS